MLLIIVHDSVNHATQNGQRPRLIPTKIGRIDSINKM